MLGIAINVLRGMEYLVPELELRGSGSESCPRYGNAFKSPTGIVSFTVPFVKSLMTGRHYLFRQTRWRTDMISSFDFRSLDVSGGVYTLLTGKSLDG